MKKTKDRKVMDSRISKLFSSHCHHLQVPIMALPHVYAAGAKVALTGASDDAVGTALRDACLAAGATATTF